MKYIRYLYILYSSGSQPVCRGTLVCREHLPSVPQLTGWDTIENHCMVYCVPCKTENDYTLFLWKTSSCSETLKDEHLNKGRNENIPSSTDKLVSLQHKINRYLEI